MISFLLEPANAYLLREELFRIPSIPEPNFYGCLGYMDRSNLRPDERLSGGAEALVDAFVVDLGLKPDRFVYVVQSVPSSEMAASGGSIKDPYRGVILIDPKMAADIESAFSNREKFTLAHEIAHLVSDDGYIGRFEKERSCVTMRLLSYGVAVVASAAFFPINIFGFCAAHLAGCIAGKSAGLIREVQLSRRMELKADLFAGAISKDLALGGLDLMEEIRKKGLEDKVTALAQIEDLKKSIQLPFLKCVPPIARLFTEAFYSERLSYVLERSHPPIQDRVTALIKVLHSFTD